MIQEEYVTFNTARLLKEAGYSQDSRNYYDVDGNPIIIRKDKSFAAPTQAQAMRWLREEKMLVIEPRPCWPYDGKTKCVVTKWCAVILKMFEHPTIEEAATLIKTLTYFPTYEAAAEAGIQAACEYLIEKGGEG